MPEKKFDVITALDICVDLLVDIGDVHPAFDQKEKIVRNYNFQPGGSSVIFASQAAKLGLKVGGIGRVGQDMLGEYMVEKIISLGINTDYIERDADVKTGIGIALCKENDRAILTYPGSIDALHPHNFKTSILDHTRHLHIGSFYLMKNLQSHYINIVQYAKRKGVTISLDTNWDPDERWDANLHEILPYVDIFLPNQNEALFISRKETIQQALHYFSKIVPTVIIKIGKNGAIGINKDTYFESEAMRVDAVDSVGAGDNFNAGFVYGVLAGYDMQHSLRIANICGGLSVTQSGGILGQPDRTYIENVLSPHNASL